MPRLESEKITRFKIASDDEIKPEKLRAMPLSLRKQMLEQFDQEFIIAKTESKNRLYDSSTAASSDVVDFLANAQLLYNKKEFQLSQNLYKATLKIDPNNECAIRGMANCAKVLSRHEDAVKTMRRLVENYKTPENYKLLGDQLYEMNYNVDALEAYMYSLREPSFSEEVLFIIYKNIGNIYLRIADPDGAEEFYNKAYTINPDSDDLLVNFGSLAVYRGELDKALARFREAVNLNDKNDKAWVGLAMIHREYGDSELAWANIEKALDFNSGNEAAIRLVTDWAMKDNEINKAISRIENYLAINDKDAMIKMWLAKFLYFSNHLESARKVIEAALMLDSTLEGGVEVRDIIYAEIHDREARRK
ncbi:MAG: hypothetical protein A2Z20_05765 [Bdellovibrionales bacterium RBG_16_40_8]|nr:MAG: hypothetical protein A2Z20_05765 [Bdellovibrionales bacterium RBG_16_40_8]